MSALKLDSLSISGFRAFEHLAIDRLGRVNLIVGKNNVGKTCLLEALRRGIIPFRSSVEKIPRVLVPADGLNGKTTTALWDKITLRASEALVVEGLRIIAPEVERVILLGQDNHETVRVPFVQVRGVENPVPLRMLGGGMNRIFGLVLAAVNAQNGLLLVDEIASGLHYTVLKDLWTMLFQIATRLDIQIFATTHSWDCIEGFQEAAAEDEAVDIALIRLERRKGHIVPILFDKDRLSIATRQNIEIR